jgi:galactan 5-O-arabinofuranosyltransferase
MKPVTLGLAVLVPVLAFLLWRRVLPEMPAAIVVAVTSLATADLVRPDEWLVLALVVPWFLELVRDLRTPGARRLSVLRHGLVLGALLLVHAYYFVPLALIACLGVVVDVALRREWPLRPARALAVAAIGLVVASVYWAPMAVSTLRGDPSDNLQRRWSPIGMDVPPLPVPNGVVGAVGLLGVLWVIWRARRSSLALALGTALIATYAFQVGGQLLQPYGVALLPEKSDPLLTTLLLVAGVIGACDLVRLAGRRTRRVAVVAVAVVATTALVLPLLRDFVEHWVTGRPPAAAQQTRYPDGSFPAGGVPAPGTHRHPWAVSSQETDPSTDQVKKVWATLSPLPLGRKTVLVTARADLLATTPTHPFTAWKGIYSHPLGQYDARVELLRRVAACPDPECAHRLLRDNPYDAVDGLVLSITPAGLRLALTRDNFPDAWVLSPIVFRENLFVGPGFTRSDAGSVAVIAVSR